MLVARAFLAAALVLLASPFFINQNLNLSPINMTAAQTRLELGRNVSSTTKLAVEYNAPYYVRVAVESSKSEDSVVLALKDLLVDWRLVDTSGASIAAGRVTGDSWSIRSTSDARRFQQHYWMSTDTVALKPGNGYEWIVSLTNVPPFLEGDMAWVELQMFPAAGDELAKPLVFWYMVSYWSRILGAICAFVGLGLYWWAYRKERKPS